MKDFDAPSVSIWMYIFFYLGPLFQSVHINIFFVIKGFVLWREVVS